MKKSITIMCVSLFVLLVLLSGCTKEDFITGKISKEIKCTDSDTTGRNDFGLSLKEFKYVNINQQGTARGLDKNSEFTEIIDSCTKNGELNEIFCKLDEDIIDSKVFVCPAGKTCRNGACETYISIEQPEFRTARVYTGDEDITPEESTGTTGAAETERPLPDHLIAWYPLNGDARDIVNDGLLDGLLNGEVTFVSNGVDREAASFADGSNYIEVTDLGESVLDLGDGFTIMVWVNTAESNGQIINKGNNYRLMLTGDRPQFYMFTSGGSQLSITPRWSGGIRYNVPNNDWEHIAGTISADNRTLKLYINGDLNNYITYSTSRPLAIGDFPLRIGGDLFSGLIDNVMIFNTELSEEQIAEYMALRV